MALGALIGAGGESEEGRHALVALGGRPLVEMQVRSLAAHGAAPIVIYPEVADAGLEAVVARLRGEGFSVVIAGDAEEAAARFAPEDRLILLGDAILPDPEAILAMEALEREAIAVLPDDGGHDGYERIDLEWRWAGLALASGESLRATAAMVGDWDLVSTLLRRLVQGRRDMVPVTGAAPLRIERARDATPYAKRLQAAARGERRDWLSRFVLWPIEEFLTEKASVTSVRPAIWDLLGSLLLIGAALSFAIGPKWLGLLFVLGALFPDLVARQVSRRRLRAPDKRLRIARRALFWVAMVALGYRLYPELGWSAAGLVAAMLLLATSADLERDRRPVPGRIGLWLFHWRPALLAAGIGVVAGQGVGALLLLTGWAAASFLLVHRRKG